MTKDNSTQVEQFSETAEKGIYIFFDPTSWERVRVSYFITPLTCPAIVANNMMTDTERNYSRV
jgi:hypothetical protein